MARASIPTLLSLDRFAKIMGVIPPHFNQGTAGTLFSNGACSNVWYQYAYQMFDAVSREDLALEINNAEDELAKFVGYNPAPKYVVEDIYVYEKYHRREYWQSGMGNVRDALKSINLKTGKFVGPGRRAVALIGTATTVGGTLVLADLDGDGFVEDARIVLPTTLTDVNEVKAFFPGMGAAPEWEIRSERSKVISGGFLTMHFYVWQIADPDLWEAFPGVDGLTPIDFTLTASFVASVDVYREVRDTTQVSAEFLWNGDGNCNVCGGTGCSNCSYDSVDGCLYARDPISGIVVPYPASYDSNTSSWTTGVVSQGRDPDLVKCWYMAGEYDQRYLSNQTHDPLSDRWARIIAYMATARFERPFCQCGNSHALAEWLREDLAFTPADSGSRFTVQDILDSPFGTHRGEVMAWQQVKRLKERVMMGIVI